MSILFLPTCNLSLQNDMKNQQKLPREDVNPMEVQLTSEQSSNGHQQICTKSNCLKILSRVYRFWKQHQKACYSTFSILMSIITLINYNELRQQCPYTTEQQCLPFILSRLGKWVTIVIFNSIFLFLQVLLLLKQKGSNIILVFGVSQIFYLLIYSDQTISIRYYIGAVNLIHIFFISLLLGSYFLVVLLRYLYKKNRKRCLTISAILIIIVSICFFFRVVTSCQGWSSGITGEIQSKPGLCGFNMPSYCWYKVLDGLFDASYIFKDCHLSSSDRLNFKKFYQTSLAQGPFLGFPNTNYFSQEQRHQQNIQRQVFDNTKGYATLQDAQRDKANYDMIFDSQNQKYYINVRRNQSLVAQRKKLWTASNKLQSPPLGNNILLLYIDAISRPSMHLKLPELMEFFDKRARQNSYTDQGSQKPADLTKDEAYEFYRYNAYYPETTFNQMRMFYGASKQELEQEHQPEDPLIQSVFRLFQNKGYILGMSNSFCSTVSMGYDQNRYNLIQSTHFDHEIFSYACDPNFMNPQNPYGVFQGPYSLGKRCLYDKTLAQYTMDATKSFFEAYKDVPKVYLMQLLEGHEGTGEVIKSIDKPLSRLLTQLEKQSLLEDTTVVVFSDHGLHMHGILKLLSPESVNLEMLLPGMMVSLPAKMNNIYREKIALNQQAFLTALNFYHFIRHIVQGVQYENREMSLMGTLSSQTCQLLHVNASQCACKF